MDNQSFVDDDMNETVFNREEVNTFLSDGQLKENAALLLGKDVSAEKKPASRVSDEIKKKKRDSKSPPVIPKHERSLSSGSEAALHKLEFQSLVAAQQLEIVELKKIIEKQSEMLTKLHKSDLDTRDRVDKLTKVATTDFSGIRDSIDSVQRDLRKRIDDTLEVHKETPALIERLIEQTNNVLSYLPEETKTAMKEVKLEDDEKKNLEMLRNRAVPQKKKLPKHLRNFA